MKKSIGIIVLNWQGWQDTLICLDSLRTLTVTVPFSIIICDNGSTNDSWSQILNWARQYYAPSEIGLFEQPHTLSTAVYPLVLIQTGANLGFSGGNNVGIRYALATQHYDYLWLLNNDTQVDAQALSALYRHAQTHPQMALIGSTIIDYYQPDTVQCAGGCRYWPHLTIFRQVLGGQSLKQVMQQADTISLDYVYGAALFLPVKAIEKIGLLNEDYFLFYEELDYSQRLKRQGYQIGWCKKSLVYHKGSASVGPVQEGDREKLRWANYHENLSTLKYTANFYPYLLPWVMVFRFLGKSFALIWRGDFYLFRPLGRAYWDFLFKRLWSKF